jgi:predicted nicotinamide N-methyase
MFPTTPFRPDDVADPAVHALLSPIAGAGPFLYQRVTIPGRERIVEVIRPADIDLLLDRSEDDPEQNLPYWAEIWPSGIALAREIDREPALVQGLPVLELGSGIGITAAVAVACGANLTITDYAPESLILARLTCHLHAGTQPQARQVNWRDPAANLLQANGERWPVVLAADVLYEERDIEPVFAVFDRILAPGGMVWLADPGRRPAGIALERARERGWEIETTTWGGPWPDLVDINVTARIHRLRRRGSIDN